MYLCPKGASMFFLISARQKYIDLEVFPLSFLERTRAGIKEAFAYAEGYEETVTALGVNLLKSADRENRLEYLKGLAARQKAAAKKFKRKDPVTSLLNWSDYYRTMADITALEKEIEELDLATCELCDEVKDCYLSPVDLEEPPVSVEADPAKEDDSVFADTDQPIPELAEQPEGEAADKAETPADDEAPVTGDTITAPAVANDVDEKS